LSQTDINETFPGQSFFVVYTIQIQSTLGIVDLVILEFFGIGSGSKIMINFILRLFTRNSGMSVIVDVGGHPLMMSEFFGCF